MYEFHIEYSQNGRVISDEIFRSVPFFWAKEDELSVKQAAWALVDEMGCGTAAVYITNSERTVGRTYISTNMHYPGRKAVKGVN